MKVWIRGCEYDVTGFRLVHPGGARVLERAAGHDVTDAFEMLHSRRARTALRALRARPRDGADDGPSRQASEGRRAAGASRQSEEEGLRGRATDSTPGFASAAALFAAAVGLTLRGQGVGRADDGHLLAASRRLGHDLGHSSVFPAARTSGPDRSAPPSLSGGATTTTRTTWNATRCRPTPSSTCRSWRSAKPSWARAFFSCSSGT